MPNERTSLLPPSGISTNEYTDRLLRTDYGGYSDIGKSNDYLSNKQWDDNRSSRETNRQGSLTAYSKSDERIGHRDHSDKVSRFVAR